MPIQESLPVAIPNASRARGRAEHSSGSSETPRAARAEPAETYLQAPDPWSLCDLRDLSDLPRIPPGPRCHDPLRPAALEVGCQIGPSRLYEAWLKGP